MIFKQVIENKGFIGRDFEQTQLKHIENQSGAKLVIAYGRRRVGKTELLEQHFRARNILKFEGIESISLKGKRVYKASYLGGLINQRRD